MDKLLQREIQAENAREVSRPERMAARDWSIVLAAVVLIAAIFGFIYFADNTPVNETGLEPAAGTSETGTSYDLRDDAGLPAQTSPEAERPMP